MSEDAIDSNLEKYRDPEQYDLQYDSYLTDLPLILEWAKRLDGPIADLACGTGRLTIPLANLGFTLTGVDLHAGMLDRARLKATANGLQVHWVHQDCTHLLLPEKYRLIYMTGNAFQHFLTNEAQSQFMRAVYQHLADDGIFIFGTRFPVLHELASDVDTEETYVDTRNRRVVERTVESYDSLSQVLYSKSIRRVEDEGNHYVEEDGIALRYVFPEEMKRLILSHGLSIDAVYGTWDKQPLREDSQEMIYVCRKPR